MENKEFAECYFCKEKDSTKLLMSTRVADGIARTIDICFSCLWRDGFEAKKKTKGKDGKSILSEEELFEGIESVGNINPLGLRERV